LSAAAAGAEGGGAEAEPARRGGDPLGPVVFAALVAACLLAFFLTQRLKHTPTAVQNFQLTANFSPTPTGRHKQEQISFKLRNAEEATVSVIDAKGTVVATLLRHHPVPRYKQFSLHWNGHRGTASSYRVGRTASGHPFLVPANRGALAPPGEYRIRLNLSRQRSPVLSPRSFVLVAP
jgi:hypothetical protein